MGEDNQLDYLIEIVFDFLSLEEVYKPALMNLRKKALSELKLESSLKWRTISPKYPSFQLGC